MKMSSVRLTLNHCGFQSSSTSPLIDDWISSFDHKRPLLDIGCAYGINTYAALARNIPTIALDICEGHIDILKQNLDERYSHLLQCVVDSLPLLEQIRDSSVSGILCSDVLHFLDGKTIEESLVNIRRKLTPGGYVFISTISDHYLGHIDVDRQHKFHKDRDAGIKWPGVTIFDEDFKEKFISVIKDVKIQDDIHKTRTKFLHFCSKDQLLEQLEVSGFKIRESYLGEHPGHPDSDGIGTFVRRSVHIIAQKVEGYGKDIGLKYNEDSRSWSDL